MKASDPLTVWGTTRTIDEWAADRGLCPITAQGIIIRLKLGWTPERAITLPKKGSSPPPPTPKKTNGKWSEYRGVTYAPTRCKWKSQIWRDQRMVHLGWHDSEREAALAYDRAALERSGKSAKLNILTHKPSRIHMGTLR